MSKTANFTFEEAEDIYWIAEFMKDEIPDGMWLDIQEAAEAYQESAKTDIDKQAFADDIKAICEDWGYYF